VSKLKQQQHATAAQNDTLKDERHKLRMRLQQLDALNLGLMEKNGELSKVEKEEETAMREQMEGLRREKEALKVTRTSHALRFLLLACVWLRLPMLASACRRRCLSCVAFLPPSLIVAA
jgi:uncharacterized membrane protein YcaP (DUF421 family)